MIATAPSNNGTTRVDSGVESCEGLIYSIVSADFDPSNDQLKTVLQKYCTSGSHAESRFLETKERFDDSRRGKAELAKDVVAMANAGGGLIVFGIADDGRRIGCDPNLSSRLDPARVSDQLRSHAVRVHVETTCHTLKDGQREFVFLRVRASSSVIVFESDCLIPMETKKPVPVIREGVVYTRRPGGNIMASQIEMTEITDRISQRKVSQFLARIQQVATWPEGAPIVAQNLLDPSNSLVVTDRGIGIPVKVEAQPGALPVAMSDVISSDMPLTSLASEIVNQIRQWRYGERSHRVNRPTLNRWYLQRDGFEMGDEVAEFGLLSAGYERGFPMFWASSMSSDRLREVLINEIEVNRYPMIQAVPYLVACFFWDERLEILEPLTSAESVSQSQARGTALRVCSSSDAERFRLSGRTQTRSFELDGTRIEFLSLANDVEMLRNVYDSILLRDIEKPMASPLKQATHQLDMMLHARLN